jgi:ubiquinone/menaquinone biosynthesis C-methylase UbiE
LNVGEVQEIPPMAEPTIRFNDGAVYERTMGIWSRQAGEIFINWLAPAQGLRWVDVGCGSGAFSELLAERCAPAGIEGVDPSDAQLAFARTRPAARIAAFRQGDAMALPFPDDQFDAAVMALVIFFVPDPAKGVAEMARVVRPGGTVAAYAWDILGGGFPFAPLQAEMRARGVMPALPPSVEAARTEAMRALWTGAGLEAIETREITVERSFADFDEYWANTSMTTSARPVLDAMTPGELEALKAGLRKRVDPDGMGRVTRQARANAVKGRVPA